MTSYVRRLLQRIRSVGSQCRRAKSVAVAVTPVAPLLFFLVPLKPWFPILGPIKSAFSEILDNFATAVFELFGILFVGLLRPFLFITPPGDIAPLDTFYNSLIGVFIAILLIGPPIYLLVSMIFPESPKSSVWRLAERMLVAVVVLLAIRPIFDMAVVLTNEVGRYLLGTDYSIELIGAGIKQLAVAGGAQAFGILIFAILASFSTLITVGFFFIVLMMRMLLVYVVYALIPLLIGMWIVDVGPMKYASQASSLIFKAAGILLVFGILVSGILAAGDAIGGEQAAEALQGLNDTNATGGEFQAAGGSGSGGDGTTRGGVFQAAAAGPGVSEAGLMTKIMGYLGSMWLVIVITYSMMGLMIQTGSTSRRHRGAGTGQHVGKNKQGAGQYGGSAVVSETDDGGMVIQDAQTGRGVYLGEDGQTSMFGDIDGGSNESGIGNANVSGEQLDDVATADMAGNGAGAGGNGVDGDIAGGDDSDVGVGGDSVAAASGGGSSDDAGGGTGAGGGGSGDSGGGTAGGSGSGDVFDDDDTDIEPMSLREKSATAASKPRDWIGGGAEAIGSAAERAGYDRTGGAVRRAGSGLKEYVSRDGASSAAYYGATFGGLAAVDENSGRIHRSLGRGVRSIGRAAKGTAKTYGKMFGEEDPVRSTRIGVNAMRRSPIGDSRYSNVTGDLKEELRPDFGSADDDQEGDGASGGTSGGDGSGPSGSGGAAADDSSRQPESAVSAEAGVAHPPITQTVDVAESSEFHPDQIDASYPHLHQSELDELRGTLEERYGEDAVESVYSTIEDVKNKDIREESEVAVQTNERLAKEALGLEGEVRNGGELAEEPSAEEIGVYQDLNTVSQEVIRENRGDELTTFRGLAHGQNSADVVADMLANPYQDTVEVESPAVSNYTTSPEEARNHSDFLVSQNTDVEDVTLAPDSLDMSGLEEGELQIEGGQTEIDANRVVSVPDREGESTSLSETFGRLDEAGSLDSSQHQTMQRAVQQLYSEGKTVSTEAGVDRLNNWADEFGDRDEVDPLQAGQVSAMVDDVSGSPKTADDN